MRTFRERGGRDSEREREMHTYSHLPTHSPIHHSRLATERELPLLVFNGWKVRGSYTTQVEEFRCALDDESHERPADCQYEECGDQSEYRAVRCGNPKP